MTVMLNFSPETERRLRDKATRSGQSLEAYLEHLVERDNGPGRDPVSRSSEGLALATFDRLLDELSEGLGSLPSLPADFARADLYTDHD